jgi:asparagine synthase (glutamine-hydrolysing)
VSAIFGGVANGAPLPLDLLAQMRAALQDYRSIREGTWRDGDRAALGHLLIPSTPEALREEQPERTDTWTGVFDCRVDNRAELLAKLQLPNSSTDCQLFAAAFQRWPQEAAIQVLGDFSLALWDGGQQRLLLARDPVGVKPLFYAETAERFLFANDPRALLAVDGVSNEIDLRIFAHYEFNFRDEIQHGLTPFPAIRFVPPGHTLIYQDGRVQLHCYWKPQMFPVKHLSPAQLKQAPAQLSELLQAAVECRLRTQSRIGSHLSGGLDSSVISVIAARLLQEKAQRPPITLSYSPPVDGEPKDEQILVEAIAQRERLEHHYRPFEKADVLALLREPIALGSFGARQLEAGSARYLSGLGCDAVLSGWGGDHCSSSDGQGHYVDLFLKGKWLSLYQEMKALSDARGVPLLEMFIGHCLAPLQPKWLRRLRGRGLHPVAQAWLNAAPGRRLEGLVPDGERLAVSLGPCGWKPRSAWEWRVRLLTTPGLSGRNEAWAMLGARHGIEYRYPLLDRRILEFCLSLPGQAFRNGGTTRTLFREASLPWLPSLPRMNQVKTEAQHSGHLKHTLRVPIDSELLRELPEANRKQREWTEALFF